jgi:hypothetical protein
MKLPQDYVPGVVLEAAGDWTTDILEFIEQAQKDAYNQALLDVENITPEGWISIVEVKKLKIK